jgi:glycosyltransferase involved in cell wall biosynthesis
MHLTLFYRRPSPEFHSIELIFDTVAEHLPDNVLVKKVYAPYISQDFINRLKIALHARKNQGDINHITGFIHFIAPFLNKKKTVLSIHDIGSNIKRSFISQLIIKCLWFTIPAKSVAYITVISEFTKKELLQYIKIKPEKIIVIPNPVSPVFKYKPKEFNSEKPKILHIGTKINKNLERTIEALIGINCKLIIVGKPNNKQSDLLKKHHIEYENYFNISDKELLQLYEQSDIVSFVSLYEGFGMPVIEAHAVGRVVITSDIEPMKSVAGNAALLVNPYNVSEIKKGIQRIINDEKLRQELIKNGLENVKKFQAENIASQYFQLYQKINRA